MRLGVIGTGGIARRHVESLAGEPLEFVFLATSAEKAETFAREFGGQGFSDLDAFVRDGRPDAVIIAIPPHRHGVIEDRLIADGIPFLIEKPLSADRMMAETVADRLANANLVVAVGYHWRALDTLPVVRAALAGRKPRLISGRFHVGLPRASWWSRQQQSGGQFNEQACHLVDLARHVAGEATMLCAAGTAFPRIDNPTADVLPVAAAVLRFQDGALGVFSAVNILTRPGPVELEIVAEGIDIRISLAETTISDAAGVTRHVTRANPYRTQNLAFLAAAACGNRHGVFCTYEDALATHRLCQDITASALAAGG